MNTPYPSRKRVSTLSIGDRDIRVSGMARSGLHDLYHLSMTMSWPRFYAAIGAVFMVMNLVFATIYTIESDSIANLAPQGFWGAFFFSVETLATVGYGDMHPATTFAHVVATLEIFIGMMGIALITGVTFARFARPRARIIASAHPVIHSYNGRPVLMLRAANARKSLIVHARATLHIMLTEQSVEGHRMRRLYDLHLTRSEHPMFFLSWTLMHFIDENSPLHGHTPESLAEDNAGFVLTLTGVDEVTTQDMQSRHLYTHEDLRWDEQFEDMLVLDAQGREHVDYARIDLTRPVGAGDLIDPQAPAHRPDATAG